MVTDGDDDDGPRRRRHGMHRQLNSTRGCSMIWRCAFRIWYLQLLSSRTRLHTSTPQCAAAPPTLLPQVPPTPWRLDEACPR